MPKQVLLIHGWGGKRPEHWLTWLQKELEKRGYEVFFPHLPRDDIPQKNEWLKEIFALPIRWNDEPILVGHSLGCPTILRILQTICGKQRVGKAILVAGFCKTLKVAPIENFVQEPFEWGQIKQHCREFIVINSDNDPKVPRHHGLFLAEQLGVKELIEHNAGHITAPQFEQYPRALELIVQTP